MPCVRRAAVTLEQFKPGEAKLLQCLRECGADAALIFDPRVGRTAHVLESAGVFAGLADAVLCVVRLCLRKVGVACHLGCMLCHHQCCWQMCWQCAACYCGNVTHASHAARLCKEASRWPLSHPVPAVTDPRASIPFHAATGWVLAAGPGAQQLRQGRHCAVAAHLWRRR